MVTERMGDVDIFLIFQKKRRHLIFKN